MMYYMFVHHQMRPSEYYSMPQGERTILRAFYEYRMKEMRALLKKGATGNVSI